MFKRLFNRESRRESSPQPKVEYVGTGRYKYSCKAQLFYKDGTPGCAGIETIEGTAESSQLAWDELKKDKEAFRNGGYGRQYAIYFIDENVSEIMVPKNKNSE